MPEYRTIGTVPAHDSASFTATVEAQAVTHHSTGEVGYWLEIENYHGPQHVRLDRAGWLALHDLCQRVADEMEGDDGDE